MWIVFEIFMYLSFGFFLWNVFVAIDALMGWNSVPYDRDESFGVAIVTVIFWPVLLIIFCIAGFLLCLRGLFNYCEDRVRDFCEQLRERMKE